MQMINAHATADQTVARLTKEAAVNASSHLLRLWLLSQEGAFTPDQFEGAERDFFISVVYSMNEQVAILGAVGGQLILDAIALQNPAAMDYYDKAIRTLHKANMVNPELQDLNRQFEETWERVRPSPKKSEAQKQRDEQIEKAFAEEDDGLDGKLEAVADHANAAAN